MFWGGISGIGKGPGIFWEKNWGGISAASYCEHIVLVVDKYIKRNGLMFM